MQSSELFCMLQFITLIWDRGYNMNFCDRKLKLKWKRSFTGFSITNSLESNENEKSARMVDENCIWLEIHFN